MIEETRWVRANQDLVAKSLGELTYEQVLHPTEESHRSYTLSLHSGVTYSFQAWKTVWEQLRVDSHSVRRSVSGRSEWVRSAGQFFIDAQTELKMTDLILGTFLEEMQSTLSADVRLLEKNADMSVQELANLEGNEIQNFLNGHPKILLNKGRMGWGTEDLRLYSPEQAKPFQLFWVALDRSGILSGMDPECTFAQLYLDSVSPEEVSRWNAILKERGLDSHQFVVIPVHPWQWEHKIQLLFADEIALNRIIPLGISGDFYRPQISIRTLSNATRPEAIDLKLPLSILNTSAVRGLAPRYMASAPEVASALSHLCETDPFLVQSRTQVLRDRAGVSYSHPLFSQVQGAPYRYQECLGVLWRESAQSKLARDSSEVAILTASLFHQDLEKNSLVGAYIQKSKLSPEAWLRSYFNRVVIPLYHLQLQYGIGLVAHGQNTVLILREGIPHGLLLKDFQGDLRISSEVDLTKLCPTWRSEWVAAVQALDRLPENYLIHDLLTGHFSTVLRFLSGVLEESDQFSESKFYQILADCLQEYVNQFTPGSIRASMNLFRQKIARVLLNPVRFQVGYADSSSRPLPLLGSDLAAPWVRRVSEEEV